MRIHRLSLADSYTINPIQTGWEVRDDDGNVIHEVDLTPPPIVVPSWHAPEVADIVGGTQTDPGDTELDNAIEIIVADYIPDSLLRVQLAKRILREVLLRTPIDDPYAHRIRSV